jgi:hypothetical protein
MTTFAIFLYPLNWFSFCHHSENLPQTSLEACKELLHLDEIQALNGSLKLSLDPGCVVI